MFKAGDPRVTEALVLAVLPRGDRPWQLIQPYRRNADGVEFGRPITNVNALYGEAAEFWPEQWRRVNMQRRKQDG